MVTTGNTGNGNTSLYLKLYLYIYSITERISKKGFRKRGAVTVTCYQGIKRGWFSTLTAKNSKQPALPENYTGGLIK
jgi:hypothetical protein